VYLFVFEWHAFADTGGALPKPRCSENADPSESLFAIPIVLQIRGFAFSFLS
jgi:hypothetical protein